MTLYFAVYISSNGGDQESSELIESTSKRQHDHFQTRIFDTLQDAIKFMKQSKSPTSRFKSFHDLNEALNYAKYGTTNNDEVCIEHDNSASTVTNRHADSPMPKLKQADAEKSFDFSAPTRPELSQLRKLIERFDDDGVEKVVWSNPRYLINCNSDSPTILFEGCRYNALHIAAKCGNKFVCELVLHLFGADDSAPTFLALLFKDEQLDALQRRQRFLLDMYVNTPDKARNETPLHFAAHQGHWAIVRLLCSLPVCNRNAVNKYNETAAMLAHERSDQQFFHLDDNQKYATVHYIGLYRVEDNSSPPYVNAPCVGFPPTAFECCDEASTTGDSQRKNLSCYKSMRRLVAFAGPMNEDTARNFYADWTGRKNAKKAGLYTSPAFLTKKSDLIKGAEVLGRELADRYSCDWREYWPFLNTFCDLSSDSGRQLLEKFLSQRNWSILNSSPIDADELALRLKLLPSPFFSDSPKKRRVNRTASVDVRAKLNFDEDVETSSFNSVAFLDDEKFYDALENAEEYSSEDTITLKDFSTPPESPPCVFLEGSLASKTDYDVYAALGSLKNLAQMMPNLRRWNSKIEMLKKASSTTKL